MDGVDCCAAPAPPPPHSWSTLLPERKYPRYPRRGAFCHSALLQSAVLASIDYTESGDAEDLGTQSSASRTSFDRTDDVPHFLDPNLVQGKHSPQSPLKRTRTPSMEEGCESTDMIFISNSFDIESLSMRVVSKNSSQARRVAARPSQTNLDR